MKATDFYTKHLVAYDRENSFDARSSIDIAVLDVLTGKPWDDIALAYVHALRPSSIRVTKGEMTLDCNRWRVTVVIDDDNIIKEITQEVEVGLPDGIEHGEHLRIALHHGIDSEQSNWYKGEHKGYLMDGINGIYYKQTADGLIPFPTATGEEDDTSPEVQKR